MKICKRCIVRGHVQGVAYRASTQRKALMLHLTGYAKNLPDASVEVLVCGAELDVNKLCDWLWEGSRLAHISNVECTNEPHQPLEGFVTL